MLIEDVYIKCQHQLCNDTRYSVLIENNGGHLKMGFNPNLERLHCFQWEQNRWRHCRVFTALTLTLGVNGPLVIPGILIWFWRRRSRRGSGRTLWRCWHRRRNRRRSSLRVWIRRCTAAVGWSPCPSHSCSPCSLYSRWVHHAPPPETVL